MRNKKLILFFGLAVLIYGIAQYWDNQRSSEFKAPLLDFLPEEVTRITVAKANQQPFTLLRHGPRWLLSSNHINETANAGLVEDLLLRLSNIRTEEIVSQRPEDWEKYGVGPAEGLKICLYFGNKKTNCLRIGQYTFQPDRQKVAAFARLGQQAAVYAFNGLAIGLLEGDRNSFRNQNLLQLQQPVTRMVMRNGEQLFAAGTRDGQWLLNDSLLLDSLVWFPYALALQDISSTQFADDIDELALDSLRAWQLTIYYGQDSVLLNCYRDSTRQHPFILHSDQHPRTWLSSDSSGIFRILSRPWQKLFHHE
jgi:hypothetical protein